MKVQELIQDLLLADPEAEVLLASDAEGNSIKPLFGGDPYSQGYWDGEESIYDEEDAVLDADIAELPSVIVLWPV